MPDQTPCTCNTHTHTRVPAINDSSGHKGSRQRQLTTARWSLASVPIPQEPDSQAPASSVCSALLALTLDAMAESLSAAEGLLRQGARVAPMASTLLISAPSLAALRTRLACTLGVGGTHGCTTRQRVAGRTGWMVGTGGSTPPSWPMLRAGNLGLSVESLRSTSVLFPPSATCEALQ